MLIMRVLRKRFFLPIGENLAKKQGLSENHDIVKNSDLILAIWDGQSRGTQITLNLAIKYKKSAVVCRPREFNYELYEAY